MKYFAYGSNMSPKRIQARAPSARCLGVHTLSGHKLLFHKIGKDGSGKCNAYETGIDGDVVEGVVFEIDPNDIKALDDAEGSGYKKTFITVNDAQGDEIVVFTYFATQTDDTLMPFSWYKTHVLMGAKAAGLSEAYISRIKATDASKDPDPSREQRELMIYMNSEATNTFHFGPGDYRKLSIIALFFVTIIMRSAGLLAHSFQLIVSALVFLYALDIFYTLTVSQRTNTDLKAFIFQTSVPVFALSVTAIISIFGETSPSSIVTMFGLSLAYTTYVVGKPFSKNNTRKNDDRDEPG